MEAAHRLVATGKRHTRQSDEARMCERRRIVQLAASLGLFLLVFLGRNAFPGLAENLREVMLADTDFAAAFQRFEADVAADESIWLALKRLGVSTLGAEKEVDPEPIPVESESIQTPIELTFLSDTKQHGLLYFREHGLRPDLITSGRNDSFAADQAEPMVVTAVAQPYNEKGEALPSNVSYEYYEFGLEKTICPVEGIATSGFAYRISPITGRREFHLALDIAAEKGTEIHAFADGVVRYIGESDEFGLYFMIDHDNGVATFYAHCSKLYVHKGDVVTCGQTVALVGETGKTTGPHLHFTIEKDGIRLNPAYYVDPS